MLAVRGTQLRFSGTVVGISLRKMSDLFDAKQQSPNSPRIRSLELQLHYRERDASVSDRENDSKSQLSDGKMRTLF